MLPLPHGVLSFPENQGAPGRSSGGARKSQTTEGPATPAGTSHPEDRHFLDHIQESLLAGQVTQAMEELFLTLRARRLHDSPREWHHLVALCLAHPLR